MAIGFLAVSDRLDAIAFAGDDGRCAALPQPIAEGISVISFVGQNFSGRRQWLQQRDSGFAVKAVAARQQKADWTTFSVDHRVDFGRATTTADTERLVLAPFLPRAARWALMAVLSMAFS